MPHDDHFHCTICRAEFDSKSELEEHNRARHTQQGLGGVSPSNEYREDARETPRKDREFTRRNPE